MIDEQQDDTEIAAGCVMAFLITAATMIVATAILFIFIVKAN